MHGCSLLVVKALKGQRRPAELIKCVQQLNAGESGFLVGMVSSSHPPYSNRKRPRLGLRGLGRSRPAQRAPSCGGRHITEGGGGEQ
jgi:hypothetical protein